MIKGLNHIGYAVNSIDEQLALLTKLFGARELMRESFPEMGQNSALVQIGDMCVELMEPTENGGVIAKFLESHGPGVHHVSICSTDLTAEKEYLESQGVTVLGGGDMVFTHPKSTGGVVYEMTQYKL